MMNNKMRMLWLVVFLMIFTSCSNHLKKVVYPNLSDGKYDSEFPYQNGSGELEEIIASVRFVNCIAFYEKNIFDTRLNVTIDKIKDGQFAKYTVNKVAESKTASGTGTVIENHDNTIVLLTCNHIVDFPDTIYTYYMDDNYQITPFIKSVAVKVRQKNYVVGLPDGGEMEIIAADKENDIALLGVKYEEILEKPVPRFKYPMGKAKELNWGTFIYLVGFPKGYKMVTRGIVSCPNRDKNGSFLTDATFNRGFSGGIILALRDGIPNFELMGMATSVAAENTLLLTPGELKNYDPSSPYTGNVYVENRKNINYGITYSISIDAIKEFARKNKKMIQEKGYDLSNTLW